MHKLQRSCRVLVENCLVRRRGYSAEKHRVGGRHLRVHLSRRFGDEELQCGGDVRGETSGESDLTAAQEVHRVSTDVYGSGSCFCGFASEQEAAYGSRAGSKSAAEPPPQARGRKEGKGRRDAYTHLHAHPQEQQHACQSTQQAGPHLLLCTGRPNQPRWTKPKRCARLSRARFRLC